VMIGKVLTEVAHTNERRNSDLSAEAAAKAQA
jgi:hypothetical protein